MASIYFNIQIDCESTQHSIQAPDLGERAIRGLTDILAQTGTKATFAVIPKDIRAHASIYRDIESQGHEIGLHTHPADQGYQEFLGIYGFDDQVKIISKGIDIFTQEMGHKPQAFTPGYASANDLTFPALEYVGLRHGLVSIPTRNLPQCACVWGNSPLDAHYPHRYNRCLTGDVDFVDVPVTIDPESRMWGGAHPQDLRVELVDTKNHYYTIEKAVHRQLSAAEKVPIKYIKAITHNTFDYSDPNNFRRETLFGIIAATKEICEKNECIVIPATTADIADEYRRSVPLPKTVAALQLDTRGRD